MPLPLRRKLLFAVLTCLVLLGGLELFLRATTTIVGRASIPDELVASHLEATGLQPDPDLGWVMSAEGFRHPRLVDPHRPEGSWRAVAIGDSQTFGPGLSLEQSWPLQTEAALRARFPDRSSQVISAAVPGYSSLQAIRLMRDRLAWLRPDVWLIDCRPKDAPRDDAVRPLGLERVLFYWRTYYVLRFAIERARGNTRAMPTRAPVDRPDLGNHDLILDLAQARGESVLFVDYPVWLSGQGRILCSVSPGDLPEGAALAPACQALIDSGEPPSSLFFDHNHFKARGAEIVGRAVAEALEAQGIGPGVMP